jgi:glycosyltransferase involved in cell wall biosynthesis
MFNVVVHTADVVGERMAGPGIRAWHFARELAKVAPVTLVARLENCRADGEPFRVMARGTPEARAAVRGASVLIGQPKRGFFKRRRGQRIVYDLFDPVVLELRELYGNRPSLRQRIHLAAEWARLSFALRFADLLIAAAPRQRHFYESLQAGDAPWIEVPFGVDPVRACPPSPDNIVVWGGGVWEWLDPATAVDAVVQLNREGLRCRLLFLGRVRPNAHVVERRRESRFDQLLAAGAPYVSANSEWIPFRERLSWLQAGKVAIMLHRPTAEAEYSIRTRLFDAIAAGLPVVATEKGFAAELVGREGLGIVVPPSESRAVAAAIRRLLTDDDFHAACVRNLERIRPRFSWDVVTRPLVEAVQEWQTRH